MHPWFETLKPAAPVRTHLLLASVLWSAPGVVLAINGTRWSLADPATTVLLPIAALAGWLKARFILDRTTRRIIDRIHRRGDGKCIGGFISPATWALIGLMAAAGHWLRASSLPKAMVGVLYAAIGVGLILSSRRLWRGWSEAGSGGRAESPAPSPPPPDDPRS